MRDPNESAPHRINSLSGRGACRGTGGIASVDAPSIDGPKGSAKDRSSGWRGRYKNGRGERLGKKAERTGEYMDDAAITAKIKSEIFSDPLLKVSQINVIITNGMVKPSGSGVVETRSKVSTEAKKSPVT